MAERNLHYEQDVLATAYDGHGHVKVNRYEVDDEHVQLVVYTQDAQQYLYLTLEQAVQLAAALVAATHTAVEDNGDA